MIVVDSSIALQWVLPDEGPDESLRYVRAEGLVAPDILLIETANVLAKKVRAKDLTPDAAMQALEMVKSAVSRVVPTEPLVLRAMQLSIVISHPVYDCAFLACAEQLNGKLVTRDQPFIKRATEHGFAYLLETAA